MTRLILTALGSAALLGFAVPAMAHPNDGDDEHDQQHEELGQQHQDIHEELGAIHDDAHAQGLSWYEHQRLHQQLDRAHANADYNVQMQHYYQHQNDQYRNGGYGNGSNGYYGQQPYGYSQQGYYGGNGYNRGYGYRTTRVRYRRAHRTYRGY